MSIPKAQQAWVLAYRPTGNFSDDTFRLETRPVTTESDLKDGQVLVKNEALSNDPAQRLWMDGSVDPRRLYIEPIYKNDVIRCNVIGEVVLSKSTKWEVGDRVFGEGGWEQYSVLKDSGPLTSKEIILPGQSPYIVASILGLTGQTAYLGAFEEMKLRPEHTLVVSGAAGGVGSTLVQIAKKVIGCKKVIGIAGGKDKCEWVKSIGADDCVDYRDKEFPKRLAELLPDYADFFFDNVGGEILDCMLNLIKRHGLITICGNISGYNDKGFKLTNWSEMIFNRPTIKGMLIFDHTDKLDKAIAELTKWLKDGVISNTMGETVEEANFEDIPTVYQKLFTGGNTGKLITKLK